MIRTVIVEDEPLARDLLRSYIALHDDLELIGEAGDGRHGLSLTQELEPDLLLLDIGLPGLSGLEIARKVRVSTAIIFTTAYDAHALLAFELGAFDYLLKPLLAERFATALDRVRERRLCGGSLDSSTERLDALLQAGWLKHFFVRHLGVLVQVHVNEIVRLESDDDYTAVYVNGRRLLAHIPLRELAGRLDPAVFVRVHRCDVVNLAHVRSVRQQDRRMILTMSDSSKVLSSRAGRQVLSAFRL